MKLYGIEYEDATTDIAFDLRCRWYSKFNGARGPWVISEDRANEGGKEHEKIINTFFSKSSLFGYKC